MKLNLVRPIPTPFRLTLALDPYPNTFRITLIIYNVTLFLTLTPNLTITDNCLSRRQFLQTNFTVNRGRAAHYFWSGTQPPLLCLFCSPRNCGFKKVIYPHRTPAFGDTLHTWILLHFSDAKRKRNKHFVLSQSCRNFTIKKSQRYDPWLTWKTAEYWFEHGAINLKWFEVASSKYILVSSCVFSRITEKKITIKIKSFFFKSSDDLKKNLLILIVIFEKFPYGATTFHSIWNNIVSNLPQWDIPFCKN